MLRILQSSSFLDNVVPPVALALFYGLCALALRPFEDMPFIDDWTYALSVEQLLKTGELRISDWSAHYPIVQVLWGAVFCLPFGFSFSALRVSTSVLACVGALAFHAILRELGRPRSDSLVATFLLLTHPVFFILAFSYMTDVPFVSLSHVSFLFFLRGITRERPIDLWLGSLFALCAFLVRQVAVAMPVALLAYFLIASRRKTFAHLLPPAASLSLMLLAPLWIGYFFGFTHVYADKLNAIEFWFHVSPVRYASLFLGMLKHLGIVLCPLTLPLFVHEKSVLTMCTVAALLAAETTVLIATGDSILPLEPGSTWALAELGATLPLLGGAQPLRESIVLHSFVPAWLNYPLAVLGLLSSGVVIARLIELSRQGREKAQFIFFLHLLFQTCLVVLLWLFYDRYYLALLPSLVIILVGKGLLRCKWTVAGIGVFLLISLSGTWDNLQLGRAVQRAFESLQQQGIPMAEIDAGYPLNGWNLYGHPENLPAGAMPHRDVPRVTVEIEKPYVIAASPLPGYQVLREIRWSPSFWIAADRVYVLKK
jgi:4-amino-4-deoxy-L-arabinose transferase-like glycosyltransferase